VDFLVPNSFGGFGHKKMNYLTVTPPNAPDTEKGTINTKASIPNRISARDKDDIIVV